MNTSPNDLEDLKVGESVITEEKYGLETVFIRKTKDQFIVKIVVADTKREVARQSVSITNRDPYKLDSKMDKLDETFWELKLDGKEVTLSELQGDFSNPKINFDYENRVFEITTDN